MSEWAAKRFWTEASYEPGEGGFVVVLDKRPVRTPAKRPLAVPTAALAEALAAEWDAQVEKLDPATMPLTRVVNVAIDRVEDRREDIVDTLAAYAETDLLCYRATAPADLIARQAQHWDPLLDWAAETHGARLRPVAGVMPERQDGDALARLRDAVASHDAFRLAALGELVTISGSLVIGLAIASGRIDAESAWPIVRLDEAYQTEQWGKDDEAEASAARAADALARAERLIRLLDDA